MKYLLDTCVISELIKRKPNANVVNWISEVTEDSLFISVFTIAEIHKGIEKLPKSKKKIELHKWINNELLIRFQDRILDFNLNSAANWGNIVAKTEKEGKPIPLMDSLIAATGFTYELVVVTRNINDMKNSGVTLFNPWEEKD